MSMTSMVVLGLSIATVLLLLGAFLATLRQDRRDRTAAEQPVEAAPVEPPLPAPVAAAGHAGTDYTDPRTLRVGDKIEVLGSPVRVLGALYVSWQGQQWVEYRLRDSARRVQWLTVEMRKGRTPDQPPHLEVLLWTDVPTQGMVPARSSLIMDDVEFHPLERGTAAFRSEGSTHMPDRGLLDFADYRATDGRLLSFERVQGQPWTASYAQPLPPGSIGIISRASS